LAELKVATAHGVSLEETLKSESPLLKLESTMYDSMTDDINVAWLDDDLRFSLVKFDFAGDANDFPASAAINRSVAIFVPASMNPANV
jgi:hypothetical protein